MDTIAWEEGSSETQKIEFDVKNKNSKRFRGFKVNDVRFNRENTGNGEWLAEYTWNKTNIKRLQACYRTVTIFKQ